MMIVNLKDIPRDERHLLFCSRAARLPRPTRPRPPLTHVAAINRSLQVHGDGVSRTWPIDSAA